MRPLRGYINIMLSRIGRQRVEMGGRCSPPGMASFYSWNSVGLRSERSLGKTDRLGLWFWDQSSLVRENNAKSLETSRAARDIVCRWNRVNLNMVKSGIGKVRKSGTGMTRKEDESTNL